MRNCVCVFSYHFVSLFLLSMLLKFSSIRKSTARFPSTSCADEKLVMRRVGIPRQRSTEKTTLVRRGQIVSFFPPPLLLPIRTLLWLVSILLWLDCLFARMPSVSSYHAYSWLNYCSIVLMTQPLGILILLITDLCRRRQQKPSTGHISLLWLQPRSTVGEWAHCRSICMEVLRKSTAHASGRSAHPCHH